jgi:hypothetical protein
LIRDHYLHYHFPYWGIHTQIIQIYAPVTEKEQKINRLTHENEKQNTSQGMFSIDISIGVYLAELANRFGSPGLKRTEITVSDPHT